MAALEALRHPKSRDRGSVVKSNVEGVPLRRQRRSPLLAKYARNVAPLTGGDACGISRSTGRTFVGCAAFCRRLADAPSGAEARFKEMLDF
jgi:hypothetical protein